MNLKTNNKRTQKGITLIALVVTIVVLLILAGVSLNAIFSDSGIIQKAKDAQTKADEATQKDLEGIDSLDQLVNKYANGGTTGGKTELKAYDKAEKNADGTLKENAKYTDSEDTTVTIPKGFKVSDVASDGSSDGEQTVSTGLVIQDKDKNEFVWVPVNYTATGTLDDDGLDTGFKDTFKRSTTDSKYTEPYGSGYDGEDIEYLKMMKSVQENKGFYIGRYEAGDKESTVAKTLRSSNDVTKTVTIKANQAPYNYVKIIQAISLAEGFATKQGYKAKTKLVSSYAWDTTIAFLQKVNSYYGRLSKEGNYGDTTFSYTDITGAGQTKASDSAVLVPTGQTTPVCNIYDMGGNVEEWTTESCSDADDSYVTRGGAYNNGSGAFPAGDRYNYSDKARAIFGFRLTLFM